MGRSRTATWSSARAIAVSSATLLVVSPRYSLSSVVTPASTTTTPRPAGPGLPEHAPSVYAMTEAGSAGAGGGAGEPADFDADAPADFVADAFAGAFAPARGFGGAASAGPQVSSGRGVASETTRLSARALYARPSFL